MYLRLGTVCVILVVMSERDRTRDTEREGEPQRPMGLLPNPSWYLVPRRTLSSGKVLQHPARIGS